MKNHTRNVLTTLDREALVKEILDNCAVTATDLTIRFRQGARLMFDRLAPRIRELEAEVKEAYGTLHAVLDHGPPGAMLSGAWLEYTERAWKAEARVEELEALLREISPPAWDDERMRYVEVQIDKTTYQEIKRALGEE